MASNLGSKVQFKKLCELFEYMAKNKGSKRYSELKKYTQIWRDDAKLLKAKEPNAVSLYNLEHLKHKNLIFFS